MRSEISCLLHLPPAGQAVGGAGRGGREGKLLLSWFLQLFLAGSGCLAHLLPSEPRFLGCRWTGVNSNKTQSSSSWRSSKKRRRSFRI